MRRSRTHSRTQDQVQAPEKGNQHHAETTQSCTTLRTAHRPSRQPSPLAQADTTIETRRRDARFVRAPLRSCMRRINEPM